MFRSLQTAKFAEIVIGLRVVHTNSLQKTRVWHFLRALRLILRLVRSTVAKCRRFFMSSAVIIPSKSSSRVHLMFSAIEFP